MSALLNEVTTLPIADLDDEELLGEFADGPGLRGSKCDACATTMLGVRVVCSSCVSTDLGEVCLAREGNLYSFTRLHRKGTERTIGYVDLADNVRTLADIRDDGHELRPDMAVKLQVEDEQWFFIPDLESGNSNA